MDKLIFNKKLFYALLIVAVGFILNSLLSGWLHPAFESLNAEEKHQRITEERDLAIQEAEEAGEYRCCIHPPCTMCYMEANKWNNFTEGTCACDDLIAQGEDPCPQCLAGLCNKNEDGTCQLKNH